MNLTSVTIGNRYILKERLGTGGMGEVFRAFDRLTSTDVALKRMLLKRADLALSEHDTLSYRLAMAQEFKTLSTLRHPHIISVKDYGFDSLSSDNSSQRHPFFTMDLLEHTQTLIEAGRGRTLTRRVELLIQLLQALSYLHRRGIIHRDLKPDNVLVHNTQVKVLDFGLALAQQAEPAEPGSMNETVVGTLSYMAPEVLQGQAPGEAADLYAVGVMAYELFTGKHPFDTENLNALIFSILTQPPDLTGVDSRLRDVVERLMAKNPVQRYPNAHAVIVALCWAVDMPLPVESAAIRESYLQAARFVGRTSELSTLGNALLRAINGQGSVWLVAGESGVGKSRLLEELRIQALVQGALVLRGQAVEGGGLPYQLWRDVVRRLILSVQVSDFEAGVLHELVPDIGDLIGRPVNALPRLEGKAGQQRLALTIVGLFRAVRQPVLLLLEDLQWTWESLELLKQINKVFPELPLLVVGSYRDDERPNLPEELPEMQVMRLERLDAAAIHALSVSMLGESGSEPEVVDLLQRETEGNVFFLVEVVRVLAAEAGRLSDVGKMTLPANVFAGGIRQIVQRRLSRVPQEAYSLLQGAAVAGRAVDLALMRGMFPHDDLDEWLTICANAAVLEFTDSQWRFAHDKLREKILDELTPLERAVWHRRVAEALEQAYPDNRALAKVLAVHWREANNQEKERTYITPAAEHSNSVGDFTNVLRLYTRLLMITPDTETSARAETYLRIGQAYLRLSNYPHALDAFEKAQTLAREVNDIRRQVLAVRGIYEVHEIQANYEIAAVHLDTASRLLEKLEGDTTEQIEKARAAVLRSRANLASRAGDLDTALHKLEAAMQISQRINDPEGINAAKSSMSRMYYFLDRREEAVKLLHEQMAYYRAVGIRYDAAKALYNIGTIHWSWGQPSEAEKYLQETIVFARESGEKWDLANDLNTMGYIQTDLASEDKALAYFREAMQIAAQIGANSLLLDILAGIAQLRGRSGDWVTAAEYLGLALHHPSTNLDVQHTVEPILERVREHLPPAEVEAALARGKQRDLNAVIAELLS